MLLFIGHEMEGYFVEEVAARISEQVKYVNEKKRYT